MNINKILKIDGVSALQFEELKSEFKEDNYDSIDISKSSYTLGKGQHGEPDIFQVVIQLTPTVLSIVALWLAKQKKRRTENFSYEKVSPDGTSEKIDFNRSSYEEGAVNASQIESILKTKLDATPK